MDENSGSITEKHKPENEVLTREQVKAMCFREKTEYSEELFRVIHIRCEGLKKESLNDSIGACLKYVKIHGLEALKTEMETNNI